MLTENGLDTHKPFRLENSLETKFLFYMYILQQS